MKLHHLPFLLLPLVASADDAALRYSCDNGSRLDISFSADISGRPQATLQFADEAVTLPQVPAASGALYRRGDIRLHTKGDDAILEDGKGNLRRCTRGDAPPAVAQPAAPPPAATSSFIDVSGRISYLARIALPPDARLSLRIQAGKRTLVEQAYELNGAQVPIPFTATVDRDLIGKKTRLAVSARIDAGGRQRFAGTRTYPAPADNQPLAIDLVLKPAGHAPAR